MGERRRATVVVNRDVSASHWDPARPQLPQFTEATLDTWRTTLSLTVRGAPDPARVDRLLRREVARLDKAASRFRPDSELSTVNDNPGRWVAVSEYFAQVLASAVEAASLTDGLVNPCLADLVDSAGYRMWRDGVATTDRESGPRLSDWQDIEVRGAGANLQVRIPPSARLDLGAVAKGWLADRVAEMAADIFDSDTLANMGGDLLAVGEWLVGADPQVPGLEPQTMQIWDAAVATSSTAHRSWRRADGTRAHHIIDPRTGRSAETPWTTCSVIAATAAHANAASTAAMILGEQAPSWLESQGLDAWCVAADGRQERVGRWPQPDLGGR